MGGGGGCRTYHEIEVWTQSVVLATWSKDTLFRLTPPPPPTPLLVCVLYRPLPLHPSADRWNSGHAPFLYTFAVHSWSLSTSLSLSLPHFLPSSLSRSSPASPSVGICCSPSLPRTYYICAIATVKSTSPLLRMCHSTTE